MHIDQTAPERYPSGDSKVVAFLKIEPDEFFSRFGLVFQEGRDDLDEFRYCTFREAEIGQILLLRYKNSPVPGTEVFVDSLCDSKWALDILTHLLELEPDNVIWSSS